MSNFRARKKKVLADALTEGQIALLVEGPSPFKAQLKDEAVVIAEFGTVTAFRVVYDAYREDLFTLAAPGRPWAWWAIEGPGIEEPPPHLRIVRWHSELKQVPPVVVREKFLQEIKT
jgi:hypothetical protein